MRLTVERLTTDHKVGEAVLPIRLNVSWHTGCRGSI